MSLISISLYIIRKQHLSKEKGISVLKYLLDINRILINNLKIYSHIMTKKIHNIKGYAWIIILLSSFLLFDKYVMQVFPSLITDNMMGSFNTNATETGAL